LIASTSLHSVQLNFREEEVSLLSDIQNIPMSRKAQPFSREEDYVLYKFWDTRPRNEIVKAMKRNGGYIRARVKELKTPDMKKYIESLIKEFEHEQKPT
jgi:hypothetical protein